MSDSVERTPEAEPLKGGPAEEGVSKEHGCLGKLGLSKMSSWRTAAFLLSLFTCLIIVFAFSFILPCPVRPQYLTTWNRTIPAAATYNFLAVGHANDDKVLDVFFIYKSAEGIKNHTCAGEGLPSPCLFLLAVEGTHGDVVWETPLDAEFHWAQCEVSGVGTKGKSCLVAHANNLTVINSHTGVILWQKPFAPVISIKFPVMVLPDLDGDGINDIAVLSHTSIVVPHTPMELTFFSGKSGDVIGSKVEVDLGKNFQLMSHLQYSTASGAQYLLLHTDVGLYALSLWQLAVIAQSGLESKLKKEKSWEDRALDPAGLITLYDSVSLDRVLVVKGGSDSAPPLLLQTHSSVLLLTNKLTITWSANTSSLISVPSFGHFNKDGIPDVVLEEDLGSPTKRVVILDGKTGSVLWKAPLLSWSKSPSPASVLTYKSYSVFMMWGETHTHNKTDSEERSTFLLHPLHSDVLLARRNPAQQIMAFKATLLERGRHACYLVLSGADGNLMGEWALSSAEPVMLTKRKIKSDISESSALGVGGASGGDISRETEETVKEAFYRLRFSDETQ